MLVNCLVIDLRTHIWRPHQPRGDARLADLWLDLRAHGVRVRARAVRGRRARLRAAGGYHARGRPGRGQGLLRHLAQRRPVQLAGGLVGSDIRMSSIISELNKLHNSI